MESNIKKVSNNGNPYVEITTNNGDLLIMSEKRFNSLSVPELALLLRGKLRVVSDD
jgi:PHD/YefM family antitoxin component YafN of YafNO toxin-antitoxin module